MAGEIAQAAAGATVPGQGSVVGDVAQLFSGYQKGKEERRRQALQEALALGQLAVQERQVGVQEETLELQRQEAVRAAAAHKDAQNLAWTQAEQNERQVQVQEAQVALQAAAATRTQEERDADEAAARELLRSPLYGALRDDQIPVGGAYEELQHRRRLAEEGQRARELSVAASIDAQVRMLDMAREGRAIAEQRLRDRRAQVEEYLKGATSGVMTTVPGVGAKATMTLTPEDRQLILAAAPGGAELKAAEEEVQAAFEREQQTSALFFSRVGPMVGMAGPAPSGGGRGADGGAAPQPGAPAPTPGMGATPGAGPDPVQIYQGQVQGLAQMAQRSPQAFRDLWNELDNKAALKVYPGSPVDDVLQILGYDRESWEREHMAAAVGPPGPGQVALEAVLPGARQSRMAGSTEPPPSMKMTGTAESTERRRVIQGVRGQLRDLGKNPWASGIGGDAVRLTTQLVNMGVEQSEALEAVPERLRSYVQERLPKRIGAPAP